MTLSLATTAPASTACDALVVVVSQGTAPRVLSAGLSAAAERNVIKDLRTLGATGSSGEVTKLPGVTGIKAPLVVCVGVGKTADDAEIIRRAIGNGVRACTGLGRVAIASPAGRSCRWRW